MASAWACLSGHQALPLSHAVEVVCVCVGPLCWGGLSFQGGCRSVSSTEPRSKVMRQEGGMAGCGGGRRGSAGRPQNGTEVSPVPVPLFVIPRHVPTS